MRARTTFASVSFVDLAIDLFSFLEVLFIFFQVFLIFSSIVFILMSPVCLLTLVFNQFKHTRWSPANRSTVLSSQLSVSPADICSRGGSPVGCGIRGGELRFGEVCLRESRAAWVEGVLLLHIYRSISPLRASRVCTSPRRILMLISWLWKSPDQAGSPLINPQSTRQWACGNDFSGNSERELPLW